MYELKHKIEIGAFKNLEKEFDEKISKSKSHKEKLQLFQLYGDFFKLKGDIDQALVFWKKSNHIRSKIYKKGDYHLAWNFALRSNYYYEKMNIPLSSAFADSCLVLINRMTDAQKKEVNIHLIYNIIAQSFKQNQEGISYFAMQQLYKKIQAYYLTSIKFQLAQNTSKHDLAKTYHLLANSYTDLALMATINIKGKDIPLTYERANEYYSKADDLWTGLYGNVHYEKGKTYFLIGLLNHYLSPCNKKYVQIAEEKLQKSLIAFGVDNSNSSKSIKGIPNQSDLLMCYKYLTIHQLSYSKLNKTVLNEIQNDNNSACSIWKGLMNSSASKNKNQHLAIYSLVPYVETIRILGEKEKIGELIDKNILFEASQYLKNFDIVLSQKKENSFNYSLTTFQKSLKPNDLFIDFQTTGLSGVVVVSFISKSGFEVKQFPISNLEDINSFRKSILDINYADFCRFGKKLFNTIFKGINLSNKRLIICPDGILAKIPFEALLISENNVKKGDYAKLDYLIKHNDIQFVLNSKLFNPSTIKTSFSINAFAPECKKENLSLLPFSKSLIEELNTLPNSKGISGVGATKSSFLNLNASILHLSGHGIIDQDQSFFSKLMLSGGELTLEDVKFKNQVPKLAVLNTCNSSLGKVYVGDGINGFERVFAIEGVTSILSNIWEVDDFASNEIMKLFYSNLMEGENSNSSLKKAKLDYINSSKQSELAAPYYWAGHHLSGANIEFTLKKDNSFWFWFISGFLIVVGIIFLKKWKKH